MSKKEGPAAAVSYCQIRARDIYNDKLSIYLKNIQVSVYFIL